MAICLSSSCFSPSPTSLITLRSFRDLTFPPCLLLLLIAELLLDLGKVKVLAGAALEDVEHVQTGGLKVRGGVVRLGDEHLRAEPVVGRLVVVRHAHELLRDRREQVQARLDLRLRVVRLDRGRHHTDEPALGRHLVRRADQRHVDVGPAPDLLLGNDDLRREGVLGVGDRVVQQTDAPDDLALDADLCCAGELVIGLV